MKRPILRKFETVERGKVVWQEMEYKRVKYGMVEFEEAKVLDKCFPKSGPQSFFKSKHIQLY